MITRAFFGARRHLPPPTTGWRSALAPEDRSRCGRRLNHQVTPTGERKEASGNGIAAPSFRKRIGAITPLADQGVAPHMLSAAVVRADVLD